MRGESAALTVTHERDFYYMTTNDCIKPYHHSSTKARKNTHRTRKYSHATSHDTHSHTHKERRHTPHYAHLQSSTPHVHTHNLQVQVLLHLLSRTSVPRLYAVAHRVAVGRTHAAPG